MSLRQRTMEELDSQENVPLKKNDTLVPPRATRPVNGHTLAQAKPKQTMPPPQSAAEKTTTAPLPFKETERIPKRIVNVAARPSIKRQESILKNIMDNESRTYSRETLKSYSAERRGILDPDEDSKNEPAMVTEYLKDIFNYRRTLKESVNQENVPLKKNDTLVPPRATRPVNGHTLAQAKPKQTMPPPQSAAEKTTTAPFPFKETERIPKRIVNVAARPSIKRQESILKNIMVDEGKTSSRETLKSYSTKQLAIIDPDEDSKTDPAMVTEYLEDIFTYLRSMETKFPIREDFLKEHEITVRMRAILVDWLVEVHKNFKLYLETLHLCIAIVDRYLQKNKHVGRNSLQLLGTSAMLVAIKYEEMYIPDLGDMVYICDNTFSGRQIMSMERDILKNLDFSLGRPLSVHFLRRYNKIAQARSDHHTLGEFMLELSLLEYEMCSVNPSLQAAAACCLSLGILNDVMDLTKLWTPTLVHYTKYEYSEFEDVVVSLANILVKSGSSEYQTIRRKYASSSYSRISLNPKLQGVLVKALATSKIPTKKLMNHWISPLCRWN